MNLTSLLDPWHLVGVLGEALDCGHRATALRAELDDAIVRAGRRVGEVGSVSIVTLHPAGPIIYGDTSWIGQRIVEWGGRVVPDLTDLDGIPQGFRVVALSEDRLATAQGEVLILLQMPDGEESVYAQRIQATALYRSLPGVRAGRVLTVDRGQVFGNRGLDGYKQLLDDLVAFFCSEALCGPVNAP